ncbi:MAG: MATE family efflux transporter [Treponemataceae bacterium]|nr:MATE family efflux transporter [Treponemataceae bacterium]
MNDSSTNSENKNTSRLGANPLGYEKIPGLLTRFAIPSVIAMLVSSLYNVVDQIFIGQGVGYLGNATTNVSFPFVTICLAITLTLGIGSSTRFSIYLGKKQEEMAAKTAALGISLLAFVGILYALLAEIFCVPLLKAFGATSDILPMALEYTRIIILGMPFLMLMNGCCHLARADGSPNFSMLAMLLGAVINTILDAVFIFVLHLGVKGAAWATIIGQIASFLLAASYLPRFKRVTLKKEYFRLDFKDGLTTCKMGMSQGLNQLAITIVQVIMNQSLVYYGALSVYGSEIPLAASGVVLKVNSLVLAVIIGVNQGMQPIVGFNYGAKIYSRVKQTYKCALLGDLVFTCAGLFMFQMFPEKILALFGGGDAKYTEFAVKFMRTFLLMLPLIGVQMISSNFFTAIGKAYKGALLALMRSVFCFVPIVLILPHFLGITGILCTAPIADFLACLVVVCFITNEMKNLEKLAVN